MRNRHSRDMHTNCRVCICSCSFLFGTCSSLNRDPGPGDEIFWDLKLSENLVLERIKFLMSLIKLIYKKHELWFLGTWWRTPSWLKDAFVKRSNSEKLEEVLFPESVTWSGGMVCRPFRGYQVSELAGGGRTLWFLQLPVQWPRSFFFPCWDSYYKYF